MLHHKSFRNMQRYQLYAVVESAEILFIFNQSQPFQETVKTSDGLILVIVLVLSLPPPL